MGGFLLLHRFQAPFYFVHPEGEKALIVCPQGRGLGLKTEV